jgi:hypothetical protein
MYLVTGTAITAGYHQRSIILIVPMNAIRQCGFCDAGLWRHQNSALLGWQIIAIITGTRIVEDPYSINPEGFLGAYRLDLFLQRNMPNANTQRQNCRRNKQIMARTIICRSP